MKVPQTTIQYIIEFLVGKELAPCFVWNDSGWFENPRMPDFPVREFEGMPVLFWAGDKPDFVASAYFLLSRYEELLNPERDAHGRFPGKASVPYKNHFLDRPVVDEYSRWLRNHLLDAVPNRTIEHSNIRTISKLYLTHDVDHPFETRGLKGRIRDVVSNLIRRHKFSLKPITDYLLGCSNPDCFDWILAFDQSIVDAEALASPCLRRGRDVLVASEQKIHPIYFLLARKNGDVRDNWYLEDRRWPDLLSRFRKYGVTLGLHVSYVAGGNMTTVKEDVDSLAKYLNLKTSQPQTLYSRHHFLRMTDPSDFRHLESAGVTDDFSVGYADVAGFRVGTCRPYHWIDPRTGAVGKLVIHPMTIMECTLDGANYMGLTESEARAYSYKLIDRVAEFGGECVLLWHNDSLMDRPSNWQRRLYCDCASYARDLI